MIGRMLKERSLVCFNDGKGPRSDVHLSLALVSRNTACSCEWIELMLGLAEKAIIFRSSVLQILMYIHEKYMLKNQFFEKADWEKFHGYCTEKDNLISVDGNTEECASTVTN